MNILGSLDKVDAWFIFRVMLIVVAVFAVETLAIAQPQNPPAQPPAPGAINLDAMGQELTDGFKGYLAMIIQVVSAIAFVAVGYGVIATFMKAVGNQAAWGEVAMPILVGAVVLIAAAFFFNQASTLASAINFT